MSRVRADRYTNFAATGAPEFTHGVRVSGIATAITFSGNLTGDVTGDVNAGVVTATSFVGDGSALTGITVPAGTDWRDSSLF